MPQDERSLFGDEQAYITWKRQQEAEARAETLKATQARKKRRRVKYSDRIRRAFQQIRQKKRMAAIYADPEKLQRYRERSRAQALRFYYAHRDERREYSRVYYHEHRDERLLYYHANREVYIERKRQYRKTHPGYWRKWYDPDRERERAHARRAVNPVRDDPKKSEENRRYYESHIDELREKHREYARARRAALKAAQQQIEG